MADSKDLADTIEHAQAHERTHGQDLEEHDGYSVGTRTVLAIVALALANCNATLTNTTNTIIKEQVMSVGGANIASWIANGNFLMTLAGAPILGSLADRLGKKWFIVGGCGIGIIGSFVSSSAKSAHTLIGGNCLTGLANAGCIVSIASNQEITPNRLRPYAFGFAQTINSASAVLGVFLAAVFAEQGHWQWSYRFNGISYAIAGVAVFLAYSPPPTAIRRTSELRQILASVDFVGMILLAGSFAMLIIALTWGGTTYAWSSSLTIGLLVGGCVGLVAFGVYDFLVKKTDALLDPRLFQNRNFPILCFICMIDGMLLLGVNVLYAQEIPTQFSGDAVHTAVILSPFLITSTLGCLPAGLLMGFTKSYRTLLVVSLAWCALFTGLMGMVDSSRLRLALAFSSLFGIGTAVTTVVPIVALTLSVPSFLLGTAGTLSISARALGGIVGVTIFTSIYSNKVASALAGHVAAVLSPAGKTDLIPEVVPALLSPVPALELAGISGLPSAFIGPLMVALSEANANAYKFVWIAIAVVIAAGAIASCFLRTVKEEMNAYVESALEHSVLRDDQMTHKGT